MISDERAREFAAMIEKGANVITADSFGKWYNDSKIRKARNIQRKRLAKQ